MPLKNYERDFLFKALHSLTAQTTPDWRLLIIVEPEDRARFEHLLGKELADARCRLIVNEGRKLSGAMNTGMRQAETPFVAILLADDMWAPNATEVLTFRIRQHPDRDFFHSSRVIIDENDGPISTVSFQPGVVRPEGLHALVAREASPLLEKGTRALFRRHG